MRTLIPLILLAVLGYVGWFYWQEYTDRPLSERLLLTDFDEVGRVSIMYGKEGFDLLPAENGRWVVKKGIKEIYDQNDQVQQLFTRLAALRTDSVMRRFPVDRFVRLSLTSKGAGPQVQGELVDLYFPTEGPSLARVVTTNDVFALRQTGLREVQRLLYFDTYLGGKTLQLTASQVDSLSAWYYDSLLWRAAPDELPLLSQRFLAPAAAPNADYFDEVMDREKYFATLSLYANGLPHRVEVYQDSAWVKPYVLVGQDFPRRYFALDSLR
jgi:hypothetical protein